MNQKLKIWNSQSTWDAAEKAWDEGAKTCSQTHPLKTLSRLPDMPGITKDTARGLKWKSLKYLVSHDHNRVLPRYFFKRPVKYAWNFLRSVFRKKSFTRDGDFFFYGCQDLLAFETLLQDPKALLVVGFSYCHKPFECPSGRFTDQCMHNADNPVCRQCFIGKAVHALPDKNVIPLFIPTIHYIGEKIFEIVDLHPENKVLFLITACELTLEMFGDWGNMVDIQGIGVRLDGRVCNTMKAFELSEEGIKPGLTVVLEPTQQRILDLIKNLRKA
jgi:hypothetical protein